MNTNSARLAQKDVAAGSTNADTRSAESTLRATAWCRFINARSARKPFGQPTYGRIFVSHALQQHTGIWMLRVSHAGDAMLRCNDRVVGTLSSRGGAAILNMAGCPFERAAEFIAALAAATPTLRNTTRVDFEFELARWISAYFDV